MNINEYQESALETAIYSEDTAFQYLGLGLAGESGEVADKLKKSLRKYGTVQLTDEEKREVAKELGDVLWYVACLSHHLGFKMDEVAQLNINKLLSRKERGVIEGDGDNR